MPRMKAPAVLIVDYGMGNLFSMHRAFAKAGGTVAISGHPDDIISADRVILPGVGAFGDGMDGLRSRGLIDALKRFVSSGRPLLGVCLGMQLLMEESEEFGLNRGLGVITGNVVRLKGSLPGCGPVKIPHVGWSSIRPASERWEGGLFRGLTEGAFVYFVHSYAAVPTRQHEVLSETAYGGQRFCSAVHRDNVYGCQFHPEISGEAGKMIIGNFLYNT